jgi:hypothetical protein
LDLLGDLPDVRRGEGLFLSFGIERPGQLPHRCGTERRLAILVDLEVGAREADYAGDLYVSPKEVGA